MAVGVHANRNLVTLRAHDRLSLGGFPSVQFVAQRGRIFVQLQALKPLQLLIHCLIVSPSFGFKIDMNTAC